MLAEIITLDTRGRSLGRVQSEWLVEQVTHSPCAWKIIVTVYSLSYGQKVSEVRITKHVWIPLLPCYVSIGRTRPQTSKSVSWSRCRERTGAQRSRARGAQDSGHTTRSTCPKAGNRKPPSVPIEEGTSTDEIASALRKHFS